MQFLPQKKRKFPPIDKSKYFKFHRDYDHDTNDYVTLKDKIETLIRKGKLANNRKAKEEKTRECERSYSPRRREVNNRMDQGK